MMLPGKSYLGVVVGVDDVVAHVHVLHEDGDMETIRIALDVFDTPPQEDDEIHCWIDGGFIQARVL